MPLIDLAPPVTSSPVRNHKPKTILSSALGFWFHLDLHRCELTVLFHDKLGTNDLIEWLG